MDLLVELFTPDNRTTIMALCNPEITYVGANLNINPAMVVPTLESKDGSVHVRQQVKLFIDIP